ncbi:hypothetical protein [Streptomyces mesophilus]|uniref:hypothetical protein n=1 Tax=Streptomyces mesophilus TaxID=1775132 RepID=UPI0033257069
MTMSNEQASDHPRQPLTLLDDELVEAGSALLREYLRAATDIGIRPTSLPALGELPKG